MQNFKNLNLLINEQWNDRKKCDVIQQLTPRTGARTRYQLRNLLDLTVSIRTSRLYSQIY